MSGCPYFCNMATMKPLVLLILLLSAVAANDYYNYDDYEDSKEVKCDPFKCQPPKCTCFGDNPSKHLELRKVPQFVMLTFDDAITSRNRGTYNTILKNGGRKNKANNCSITATFFVTHEYNDYKITNDLYLNGSEIAVHSISHVSDTFLWREANLTRWKNEMDGMRTILKEFAMIPESEIVGHRAPFLQTSGNTTFQMLSENRFLYDSSMPTRSYTDPPLWPYTLDYGYPQDCQIQPCPTGTFPGLWIVPMVQLSRKDSTGFAFHCSMADACTPLPKNEQETEQYFRENFNRHYNTNKAPFPIFLHEAWLQDKRRLKGYLNFIDEILKKDDVFVVSVREVIEYMRKPVDVASYANKACYSATRPKATECDSPVNCNYPRRNVYMNSCKPCPKRYPWIANPEGN